MRDFVRPLEAAQQRGHAGACKNKNLASKTSTNWTQPYYKKSAETHGLRPLANWLVFSLLAYARCLLSTISQKSPMLMSQSLWVGV